MAQGANATFARDSTAQGIINLLLSAQARGQKAVVALDTYIFNWNTFQPFPDWTTRMDALFLGGVDPATGKPTDGILFTQPDARLLQTMAAFYLQDEPYYNGYLRNLPAQKVLDNANAVVARLKSRYGQPFATTPIAQIYSYFELAPDAFIPRYIPRSWTNIRGQHAILIPNGVTWVGFDCYNSWNACGDSALYLPISDGVMTDNAGPGSGLPANDSWYKRLKLLTSGNHDYFYPNGPLRSMLVPPSSVDFGRNEASIATWSQYYADAAQKDRAVVGIFSWLWGNYVSGPFNTRGLGSLSSHTQQAFESMARCVLNASWNHVANGSFESGAAGWAYAGSAYSVQGLLNNGSAQNGELYMGQWTVGAGWSYTYQTITGLPSGTYKLSAYLRQGPNVKYLTIGGKNCNGPGYQGSGDVSGQVGLNWTPISVPVTVDCGGVCEIYIYIYIYTETNGASDYTDIDGVTFQ